LTGCVGGVLGLANVLGQACCDLEQLYKEGKMEEAKLLQQRLIGPNMSVSKILIHSLNLGFLLHNLSIKS
jgi:dihydrodipicolinate synthase/N-acetylneuraminate lyase